MESNFPPLRPPDLKQRRIPPTAQESPLSRNSIKSIIHPHGRMSGGRRQRHQKMGRCRPIQSGSYLPWRLGIPSLADLREGSSGVVFGTTKLSRSRCGKIEGRYAFSAKDRQLTRSRLSLMFSSATWPGGRNLPTHSFLSTQTSCSRTMDNRTIFPLRNGPPGSSRNGTPGPCATASIHSRSSSAPSGPTRSCS